MKKIIAANWKMNGSLKANQFLVEQLLVNRAPSIDCRVVLCVPSIYIPQVSKLVEGTWLQVGAQDISLHESGAYTGEVSASMLQDFGVHYALVGHSERRQHHSESDKVIAAKVQRALAAGITPIICVGETLSERESGMTQEVVKRQMASVIQLNGHCISEVVVAYEPVWAIGTGLTASPAQAQEVHSMLRTQLMAASAKAASIPLLYGGSMNPTNASQLLAQQDINGGLVGGASLKASDFFSIISAAG